MKSDSLQKEQKAKKKAALNEYLEEKKELEYWIKRVEELEKINQYRSPMAATVPSGNGPGDPTAMAIMELETAKENKMEAEQAVKETKKRVLALIKMAQTADQRVLLMRRYIDGMSWEDIAEAEGKSRTWATNTHGTALTFIKI